MSESSEHSAVGGEPGYTFGFGKKHRGGTLKEITEAVKRAVKRRGCELRLWPQRRFPKSSTPSVAP